MHRNPVINIAHIFNYLDFPSRNYRDKTQKITKKIRLAFKRREIHLFFKSYNVCVLRVKHKIGN